MVLLRALPDDRLRTRPTPALRPHGVLDYRRLLGRGAWARLPADTRERFAPHAGEVTYVGRMRRVHLNTAGRVLAQLCRLLGEPLVAGVGEGIPAHVRVFHDPRGGATWERAYHFPHRPTRLVRSCKRLDRDGTLLECLGFGLHMRLRLEEVAGALHFISTGYFWQGAGLRIPLPQRWFPGETTVTHEDLGAGRFRFTLTIRHPLFGVLVHQDGVFRTEEASS